ncbi:aconitase 2 [Actinidia rufa]|uniref:Aconitase 2 n=1 Tax=Actinidia rufa TaxID=165716 RepID=A0A7J0HFT4_9ERIC|nr:aconitase 2 [Actinidia rufa]
MHTDKSENCFWIFDQQLLVKVRSWMKTLHRKVKRGFLLFPNSLMDLHHWLPVGDVVDINFDKELIRTRKDGKSVYFKDIRPSNEEVAEVVESSVLLDVFKSTYVAITKKSDGDPNIQDVVITKDVHNVKVEIKVVGETEVSQKNEIVSQGEPRNLIPETKERVFCSEASDLGTEMTRDCSQMYIVEESRQLDRAILTEELTEPLNAGEKVHDPTKDISGKDATSVVPAKVLQPVASTTKRKKKKGKNTKVSGPALPSPSAFNSTDSSSEPRVSSKIPSVKAADSQILTMQEMLNPLTTMQKRMHKQMTVITVPVTKEGRRVEAALGRSVEKAVKANSEVLRAPIEISVSTAIAEAFQEILKSSLEASAIPAFEMSCKAMFEQVDVDIDFDKELIRTRKDGRSVYFKDIRPSNEEVAEPLQRATLCGIVYWSFLQVFMLGIFANILLVMKLLIGEVGPKTIHIRKGEKLDAAMVRHHCPAGAQYGSSSSREWTANGPMLKVAKAVIANSFERIHHGNLVGMFISPLCFKPGQDADMLALTGHEHYTIDLPSQVSEMKPGQVWDTCPTPVPKLDTQIL